MICLYLLRVAGFSFYLNVPVITVKKDRDTIKKIEFSESKMENELSFFVGGGDVNKTLTPPTPSGKFLSTPLSERLKHIIMIIIYELTLKEAEAVTRLMLTKDSNFTRIKDILSD